MQLPLSRVAADTFKGEKMELRVLKYFLTVADEGNITRAADILHVTQPTLSRQLMELEDELGTALLIRGKRSVTLTDEGFLFKQQAETIVELADKLEHTFTDQKDVICGTIRIGATEAVGGRTLAICMKEFREKYPAVQFELYNGMADDIKERIEHGLLDLGLVMEPIDTSKFEYVRLPQKETWGILVRKDHELIISFLTVHCWWRQVWDALSVWTVLCPYMRIPCSVSARSFPHMLPEA